MAESHPYELLLALEDIQHRTTRIRSSQTNDFVERLNRTCEALGREELPPIVPEENSNELEAA